MKRTLMIEILILKQKSNYAVKSHCVALEAYRKEILAIEENRTEDSKCVIHLFQEGSYAVLGTGKCTAAVIFCHYIIPLQIYEI